MWFCTFQHIRIIVRDFFFFFLGIISYMVITFYTILCQKTMEIDTENQPQTRRDNDVRLTWK